MLKKTGGPLFPGRLSLLLQCPLTRVTAWALPSVPGHRGPVQGAWGHKRGRRASAAGGRAGGTRAAGGRAGGTRGGWGPGALGAAPCRAPPWPARVAMGTGCVWFWEPRVCAVFPHAKGAPVQHALRCSVLGSRSTDGHVSGPGIPFPAEPCCRLSPGPDAGGSVPSAPHLTWHRPPARRWNSHTRQSPRAAFQKMPRAPGPASPGQHVAPACLKAAVPPRGV